MTQNIVTNPEDGNLELDVPRVRGNAARQAQAMVPNLSMLPNPDVQARAQTQPDFSSIQTGQSIAQEAVTNQENLAQQQLAQAYDNARVNELNRTSFPALIGGRSDFEDDFEDFYNRLAGINQPAPQLPLSSVGQLGALPATSINGFRQRMLENPGDITGNRWMQNLTQAEQQFNPLRGQFGQMGNGVLGGIGYFVNNLFQTPIGLVADVTANTSALVGGWWEGMRTPTGASNPVGEVINRMRNSHENYTSTIRQIYPNSVPFVAQPALGRDLSFSGSTLEGTTNDAYSTGVNISTLTGTWNTNFGVNPFADGLERTFGQASTEDEIRASRNFQDAALQDLDINWQGLARRLLPGVAPIEVARRIGSGLGSIAGSSDSGARIAARRVTALGLDMFLDFGNVVDNANFLMRVADRAGVSDDILRALDPERAAPIIAARTRRVNLETDTPFDRTPVTDPWTSPTEFMNAVERPDLSDPWTSPPQRERFPLANPPVAERPPLEAPPERPIYLLPSASAERWTVPDPFDTPTIDVPAVRLPNDGVSVVRPTLQLRAGRDFGSVPNPWDSPNASWVNLPPARIAAPASTQRQLGGAQTPLSLPEGRNVPPATQTRLRGQQSVISEDRVLTTPFVPTVDVLFEQANRVVPDVVEVDVIRTGVDVTPPEPVRTPRQLAGGIVMDLTDTEYANLPDAFKIQETTPAQVTDDLEPFTSIPPASARQYYDTRRLQSFSDEELLDAVNSRYEQSTRFAREPGYVGSSAYPRAMAINGTLRDRGYDAWNLAEYFGYAAGDGDIVPTDPVVREYMRRRIPDVLNSVPREEAAKVLSNVGETTINKDEFSRSWYNALSQIAEGRTEPFTLDEFPQSFTYTPEELGEIADFWSRNISDLTNQNESELDDLFDELNSQSASAVTLPSADIPVTPAIARVMDEAPVAVPRTPEAVAPSAPTVDLTPMFREYDTREWAQLVEEVSRIPGATLNVSPRLGGARRPQDVHRLAGLIPSPTDPSRPLLAPLRGDVDAYLAKYGTPHPFAEYAVSKPRSSGISTSDSARDLRGRLAELRELRTARELTKQEADEYKRLSTNLKRSASLVDLASEQPNNFYRNLVSPTGRNVPVELVEAIERGYATGEGIKLRLTENVEIPTVLSAPVTPAKVAETQLDLARSATEAYLTSNGLDPATTILAMPTSGKLFWDGVTGNPTVRKFGSPEFADKARAQMSYPFSVTPSVSEQRTGITERLAKARTVEEVIEEARKLEAKYPELGEQIRADADVRIDELDPPLRHANVASDSAGAIREAQVISVSQDIDVEMVNYSQLKESIAKVDEAIQNLINVSVPGEFTEVVSQAKRNAERFVETSDELQVTLKNLTNLPNRAEALRSKVFNNMTFEEIANALNTGMSLSSANSSKGLRSTLQQSLEFVPAILAKLMDSSGTLSDDELLKQFESARFTADDVKDTFSGVEKTSDESILNWVAEETASGEMIFERFKGDMPDNMYNVNIGDVTVHVEGTARGISQLLEFVYARTVMSRLGIETAEAPFMTHVVLADDLMRDENGIGVLGYASNHLDSGNFGLMTLSTSSGSGKLSDYTHTYTHELGHLVDFYLERRGYLSLRDRIAKITDEVQLSEYGRTDEFEDAAESFATTYFAANDAREYADWYDQMPQRVDAVIEGMQDAWNNVTDPVKRSELAGTMLAQVRERLVSRIRDSIQKQADLGRQLLDSIESLKQFEDARYGSRRGRIVREARETLANTFTSLSTNTSNKCL